MKNPAPRGRFFSGGLALLLAFPAVAAEDPGCRPGYRPGYEKSLSLTRAAWDKECAAGKTAPQIIAEHSPHAAAPRANPASPRTPGPAAAILDQALRGDIQTNLGHFYENSSAGAAEPVAGNLTVIPPLLARPEVSRAGAAPLESAAEPPFDAKEVEHYFHYEPYKAPPSFLSRLPGPLGWLGRLIDNAIAKPLRSLFHGTGKAFTKDVTAKLEESREGRDILREFTAELKRSSQTASIQPVSYPGTFVDKGYGAETINGLQGQSSRGALVVEYNEKYSRFKDKKNGVEGAAGTLGHELNHLLFYARFKRLLPKYAEIFDYLAIDEQDARVRGGIVDWELNPGRPNSNSEAAREVAGDLPAYWARLRLGDERYASSLDLEELADPVKAFDGRLTELQSQKSDEEDSLKDLPGSLKRIEHMARKHVPPASLRWLKDDTLGDLKAAGRDLADTNAAIAEVTKKKSLLASPSGEGLLRKMRQAASDPQFLQFMAGLVQDRARLVRRVAAKPIAPPAKEPEQMTWTQFEGLWAKYHEDLDDEGLTWKERDERK